MSTVRPSYFLPAIIWECDVGTYLRSRVAGRATGGFQSLAILVGVAESEVDDLDRVVVVEQQILGFQVAMHDVQLVDVLDP